MKRYVLLVISMLLTGCSSIVDHSLNPQLSSLCGRKVLTENVSLCRSSDHSQDEPEGYILHAGLSGERCPDYRHTQIHLLKVHTPIEIEKVEEHKHLNLWKYQWWFLVGKVTVNGKAVSFYYRYGSSTTSPNVPESPKTLPWE